MKRIWALAAEAKNSLRDYLGHLDNEKNYAFESGPKTLATANFVKEWHFLKRSEIQRICFKSTKQTLGFSDDTT